MEKSATDLSSLPSKTRTRFGVSQEYQPQDEHPTSQRPAYILRPDESKAVTQESPFFRLAPEIRNHIYNEVYSGYEIETTTAAS